MAHKEKARSVKGLCICGNASVHVHTKTNTHDWFREFWLQFCCSVVGRAGPALPEREREREREKEEERKREREKEEERKREREGERERERDTHTQTDKQTNVL